MGLWKSFKNLFKAQQKAVSQPSSNWISSNANNPAFWTGSLSKNKVLNSNEEVFSVISRLSNLFASLPIHQYKKYQEKDNGLSQLLRSTPNPNMSGFELLNKTEVARNTYGNGYIWIERDPYTYNPVALWPINPDAVTIDIDRDNHDIWYKVDDAVNNRYFLVYNTEIIHVKHISGASSYYGISPIDVLNDSLKFQKEIEEFSLSEMGKKEAYIIKYDRSVSEEGRKAILNDFREMVKNNGGAILIQAGYDVDRYESKFKPSDLQTVEAISRTRIANAFNVPLSFLNDGQAKSTTNVEHVMTDFVINTLVPIIKQYESEFNRKLLTQNQRSRGYYFKFNVNGLMRGDTAARTQFYQALIRDGIATQNEIRKLEDLPPIDQKSANILWVSKDLYPSENQLQASNIEASSMQSDEKGGDPDNGQSSQDPDSNTEDSKLSDDQTRSKQYRHRGNVY